MNKIYIGNLPWSLTETQLHNLVAEFGTVKEIYMSPNKESNVYPNGGYGFVTFLEEQSAKACVDDLNGRTVSDRTLKVDFARPRKPLGYSDRRTEAGGD